MQRDSSKKVWKGLSYVFIALLFVVAGVVLVQDPVFAQAAQATESSSLRLIIARIIQSALGILALAALGLIVYAGYLWSTAQGDELLVDRAKNLLTAGIVGFVILGIAFLIATFFVSRVRSGGGGGFLAPGQVDLGGLGIGGAFPVDVIEAHYPENGQRNLARNTNIMIQFTEGMDRSSLINDGGTPNDPSDDRVQTNAVRILRSEDDPDQGPFVPASVQATEDSLSFIFDPLELLGNEENPTNYTVVLTDQIRKADGASALGEGNLYSWSFEIGTFVDLEPPHVVSVIPGDQSTHPRNVVVQVTFNEAMNPLTVSGEVAAGFDNLTVRSASGEQITGSFIVSNQFRTVEFISDEPCGTNACGEEVYCLPGNQQLSVNLRAATVSVQPPAALFPFDGITDAASNALDGNTNGQAQGSPEDDYNYSFNTTNEIDLVAPIITSVTPAPFSTQVSLDAPIRATFDKPLLFSSLTKRTVQVTNLESFELFAETVDGGSVVEMHHSGLAEETVYTPTFFAEVKDLYQNCYRPCVGP